MEEQELYFSVCTLATFNLAFSLCSLYLKDHLYVSEALISTTVGAILGSLNLPSFKYFKTTGLIFHFARLLLALQIMTSGIQLPSAYLKRHWKSVAILLGPVLLISWLVSSVLVYLLFWDMINWREAMLIGAILSPTDPVLASSIVKGHFAESRVPLQIRTLLSAESGANDGFALPPFMLSIMLIRFNSKPGLVFQSLLVDMLLRKIILSIIFGAVVGYYAREALRQAENSKLIDKESFVAFSFILAVLTLGGAVMFNGCEFLAIFVVGVVFSWDGWFEEKTADTEFQATIDLLFNLNFFVLFGASIIWSEFTALGWLRLTVIAVAILILRRLPITVLLSPWIAQLKTASEAVFVGWFGPMGVAALLYAYETKMEGMNPAISTIVNFMVLASILVHGMTVPMFHFNPIQRVFSLLPDDESEALEVLTILVTESSSDRLSLEIDLEVMSPEESCRIRD